jgi:hypothetical protein
LINIAKNFGVTDKQLRAWRKGRSAIPLKVLKNLSEELNYNLSKIEENIEYISSSKGKKVIIPKKITPKLIEILGRFCGDGSCGIYGQPTSKDYKFSFKEKEVDFVKIHAEDMNNVFGIKGAVINYNNYAENIIRSKPLVLYFMKIFGYKKNFNKTRDGKLPSLMKRISWPERKFFTTGLIDTEGCFYKNKENTIFFTIKMIINNYINEIKQGFDFFQIPYTSAEYKEKKTTFYYIRVLRKTAIPQIIKIFELKNKRHYNRLKRFGFDFSSLAPFYPGNRSAG